MSGSSDSLEGIRTVKRNEFRRPSKALAELLANNLRAYRKQNGISQEQLAEACDLHRTYIGSVERCERNVTLSTLEVLAGALGVSVSRLLTKDAFLRSN